MNHLCYLRGHVYFKELHLHACMEHVMKRFTLTCIYENAI